MNILETKRFVESLWNDSIIPTLIEYIQIPNKSPQFDADWEKNGFMASAMRLIANWCSSHSLPDMKLEVMQLAHRTPLLFIEIPGKSDETVLLYGHLDKQPEMTGWDADLGPWKPVLRGDKLYGRGAADDGYAAFAALGALNALHHQRLPHARCVIIIEASEESGSPDLPHYISTLKERIGKPSLIVCLDSGCGNYQQMWVTTSLRGLVGGVLTIDVLKQGIHSGVGSGIVPSPFRVLRQLLNRVENIDTGNILLSELQSTIPKTRIDQAQQTAHVLSQSFVSDLPFLQHVSPEANQISDLILRRTWKPALTVIGMNGMPVIEQAGNVSLPSLQAKLSMRLPPTCDAHQAAITLKKVLEQDSPYGAHVQFRIEEQSSGWHAPCEEQWLSNAINQASQDFFGEQAMYLGEGGSIPFMGMLGLQFPQAQFVITGVLGPESNAHGPNEFLHIPTGKKLTAAIAEILAIHYKEKEQQDG